MRHIPLIGLERLVVADAHELKRGLDIPAGARPQRLHHTGLELLVAAQLDAAAQLGTPAVQPAQGVQGRQGVAVEALEVAGQFDAQAQAAARPVRLGHSHQHLALPTFVANLGLNPLEIAPSIELGAGLLDAFAAGRLTGLQVNFSLQRLRVGEAVALDAQRRQWQRPGLGRAAQAAALFMLGVARFGQSQGAQAFTGGQGGQQAVIDGALGGVEVGQTNAVHFRRQQNIGAAQLFQGALNVLSGQDLDHLIRDAERALDLLLIEQGRADIDGDDHLGPHGPCHIDAEVAHQAAVHQQPALDAHR